MTEKRIQKLKRMLQEARSRLIGNRPEYADLLYCLRYVAVDDVPRMSTNGVCIFVDPDWIQGLSPLALEFLLGHQLMHIMLGHIERPQYYAGDRYHLACDIVANSHLRALGYEYDSLPRVGKLYHTTFYPVTEGRELTAEEAFRQVPFDPAAIRDKKDERYLVDSETYWDRKLDRGERGVLLLSPEDEDPEDLRIDRGLLKNINRAGRGRLPKHPEEIRTDPGGKAGEMPRKKPTEPGEGGGEKKLKALLDSLRITKTKSEQTVAAEAELRAWQKPNDPRLDWRTLLSTFLQEEFCDYSFLPPDRRQQDSGFFLPDFHETTIRPLEVLFAVDTSGSVDEEMLTAVYSEMRGAIEQFGDHLTGILTFFDTRVYAPIRFSSIDDISDVIPQGGGGTDFSVLFRFLADSALSPASIVIFTDGLGAFPEESAAGNTPVLWLLSRDDVSVPWGKCARITASCLR